MAELGRRILFRACLEMARWPGDPIVAVNVSAVQLRNARLVEEVKDALRISGLTATRLEIELTETADLASEDHAPAIVEAIRALGVGVALDDFGTRYSSLSLVQRLALTRLKIDKSFVRTINSTRRSLGIAQAVMNLASTYDLAVTAEGVETREQMRALAGIGCRHMQGYLFGRPYPIEVWWEKMARTQLPRGRNLASGAVTPLIHVS
ncbi:hypothetical protein GCM10011390_37640 [Aureimonas endophytica]|uniref:EAL domain-containing protein n=2 Tax=Aureimonas endophytica TaxID=2027858 RepID=A0A917EAF5_9HYPH|nr:hypothetical protein GCM10011390_37640 [Aureimonas endophytica]